MNFITEIKKTKALISQFQTETNSNNVLELTVWLENRLALSDVLTEEQFKVKRRK